MGAHDHAVMLAPVRSDNATVNNYILYMHVCVGLPEFPVETVITKTCCNRKMLTCFKRLSQADIENIQQKFYLYATETEQTQHLVDFMMQHSRGDKKVKYTIATYSDIVLYDFELTTNGALKKTSRDYLQSYIKDL